MDRTIVPLPQVRDDDGVGSELSERDQDMSEINEKLRVGRFGARLLSREYACWRARAGRHLP